MKTAHALATSLRCIVCSLLGFLGIFAASAAENRVLQLAGKDCYVELPPNVCTNLTEATIEGWMKWERLGHWLRFFDAGKAEQAVIITEANLTPDLQFDIWLGEGQHHVINMANVLRTNQ